MNDPHQPKWFKVFIKVLETLIIFMFIATGVSMWFNYHVDLFALTLLCVFFGGMVVVGFVDFVLFIKYEKEN